MSNICRDFSFFDDETELSGHGAKARFLMKSLTVRTRRLFTDSSITTCPRKSIESYD